jgi:hypothetical protein
MTSLRNVQRIFARALAGDTGVAFEELVASGGIPSTERVQVYRNNIRATFLGVMQVAYPVVERLVGCAYFRQLISDFQGRYPSRSGDLQSIGHEFAPYLANCFDGTRFAYLKDVAALETAYQEVLVAADHAPFDVSRLAAVSDSDYAGLRLLLHPAARLLESRYPLIRIWRANRAETLDASPIDLDAGGEHILLTRPTLAVRMDRIERADFVFLDELSGGATLEQALEAASRIDTHLDTRAVLARYVTGHVIVDFRVGPCASTESPVTD